MCQTAGLVKGTIYRIHAQRVLTYGPRQLRQDGAMECDGRIKSSVWNCRISFVFRMWLIMCSGGTDFDGQGIFDVRMWVAGRRSVEIWRVESMESSGECPHLTSP